MFVLLVLAPTQFMAAQDGWGHLACINCRVILDLEWHPSRPLLAAATNKGVFLYETENFTQVDELSTRATSHIDWNVDGTLLASFQVMNSRSDGELIVYDIDGNQDVLRLPLAVARVDFSWHPSENILAFSNGLGMSLWDANTQEIKEAENFELDLLPPDVVSAAPSEAYGYLWRIAWSPDGEQIAVSTRLNGVLLWQFDTETVEQTLPFSVSPWERLSWNPNRDGLLIASIVGRNETYLVDIESGEATALDLGMAQHPEWSPDGSLLATVEFASNYEILIWNTADWGLEGILTGHTDELLAFAWSPDGRRLASGGEDGVIRIWEQEN